MSTPTIVLDTSGIPDELKDMPRWVGWKSRARPGGRKPEKMPVNPITGRPANHSDPRTCGPFELACRRYRDDGLSGIGFVFAGDGFAGVDLDRCRSPESGELDPWAEAIVERFATYTEVSPSGTGVKLIGRGRLDPSGRKRNGPVEVYDRSRFFAITGCRLPDVPPLVMACEEALLALQRQLAPPDRTILLSPTVFDGGFEGRDADLLEAAFAARNGGRVRALWDGNLLGHPSFSEALLGLARWLAFYTGPDEDRLERLMLGSPLVALSEQERRKWHTSRGGEAWGRLYVVRKAIESCQIFYSGPRGVGHNTYTGFVSSLPCSSAGIPVRLPERSEGSASGLSVVERAWARVEAGEFPPGALSIADEPAQRLAALCFHLGERHGGWFFLDVRTAGKLLGISKSTAARRLKVLKEANVIRVEKRGRYVPVGNVGFATEFMWVG